MTNETLLVAGVDGPEIFHTLEGEGRYVGYPAIFLRLSSCNLTCKGFISKDSPNGCDSYVSWSKKNKMTFEEIALFFEDRGFHTQLQNGAILKLTGGEPLIWQDKLLKFTQFILDRWFAKGVEDKPFGVITERYLHIDFETNGTIMPKYKDWYALDAVVTFTTSPKLSNNGDAETLRYKPEVLRSLVENTACFKFVVKQESDLEEILERYINDPRVAVPSAYVWLMPMCGSRAELLQVGPIVAGLCKKYGFKFSNRLHLQLWDLALKV